MPDGARSSRPRAVPVTVWWLALGRFPVTTATRMLAPLLGAIAHGVGVSLVTAGVIVACFESAGLAAPLAGLLVDRIGARGALRAGLAGVALAALAIAAAPNGAVLALGLVALGLASNVSEAGGVMWIAQTSSFASRAAWLGRYEIAWSAALLVGVPTAGVLALASWRLAFVAIAVAVLGVVVPLDRQVADVARPARASAPPGVRRVASPAIGRALAVFVAFGLLCGTSQLMVVVYGVWLGDRFGLSTAAIGAVAFAVGAGDLAANLANVRYTDRIGKVRAAVTGTGALVVAATMLALVAGGGIGPGLVALVALIMGFEFALLSSKPLLTELGWRRRGLGIGIGFAASAVCRALAAVVATRLYDAHGIVGPAIAAAITGGVATLVFALGVREPHHEPRVLPARAFGNS